MAERNGAILLSPDDGPIQENHTDRMHKLKEQEFMLLKIEEQRARQFKAKLNALRFNQSDNS